MNNDKQIKTCDQLVESLDKENPLNGDEYTLVTRAWNAAFRAGQSQQAQGDPVGAQHRFRHPQKTAPDWSPWQTAEIDHNRPNWDIDSIGYEVEYRLLYARPPAPVSPQGPIIEWSEPFAPHQAIMYDHVIGETPFGRFLITWEGWKEDDWPTIDETPWGEWGCAWPNVEEAKSEAEKSFLSRLAQCGHPPAPVAVPDKERCKHGVRLPHECSDCEEEMVLPMTWEQRFISALELLTANSPPRDFVDDWINGRNDSLQNWVGATSIPDWVQCLGILDAAHAMASNPVEGEPHLIDYRNPMEPENLPATDTNVGTIAVPDSSVRGKIAEIRDRLRSSDCRTALNRSDLELLITQLEAMLAATPTDKDEQQAALFAAKNGGEE